MDKHKNAEIHTDTQHTQTNSQNTTHTDILAHRHTQKHTQTPQTHALLTHCFNEKAYILNLDLQGFKTGLTQCLPHSHPHPVISLALSNFWPWTCSLTQAFVFFCAKQGEQFQLASDNDAGRTIIKGLHFLCKLLKCLITIVTGAAMMRPFKPQWKHRVNKGKKGLWWS